MLTDLYKSIGYKATAKAIDINAYFTTKDTMFSENGKRVAGFKLLDKINNNNDKIN